MLCTSHTDTLMFICPALLSRHFALYIPNCYPHILHILNFSSNIPYVFGLCIPVFQSAILIFYIPEFHRDIFVVFKFFQQMRERLRIKQTPAESFPIQLSHLCYSCHRQVSCYHSTYLLQFLDTQAPDKILQPSFPDLMTLIQESYRPREKQAVRSLRGTGRPFI